MNKWEKLSRSGVPDGPEKNLDRHEKKSNLSFPVETRPYLSISDYRKSDNFGQKLNPERCFSTVFTANNFFS